MQGSKIMARALETVHGVNGDDAQRRTMYSLDSIEGENALMDALHYFWSALRQVENDTPKVSDFDLARIAPNAKGAFLSWVDATAEDPRYFQMAYHPCSPIPGMGLELSGKRLMEIPNSLHAKSTYVEYLRCKQWRTPLYYEIEQIIAGFQRHYYRLLLPLADDAGKVTRIFYMNHFLTPPRQLYRDEDNGYGGQAG
jgi:hypothetical protein